MKDYTDYHFAAIVGAEVEMKTRDGKGTCWTVKGKVLFQDNGLVWVERNEGKRWNDCIIIREIVPGSLTAKITPKRMNLEQLKRFAKQEVGDDKDARIGIGVNVNVFYIQANWDEEQGYLFDKEYGLTDYIDCTDWGWKK